MQGTSDYPNLFTTGQYGRLYLVSSSHARGKTFRIFVLPAEETSIPNGSPNPPLNADAVEVFGVTGGHPGWTETYGWLHHGPWEDDFYALVIQRREERRLNREENEATQAQKANAEQAHQQELLAKY